MIQQIQEIKIDENIVEKIDTLSLEIYGVRYGKLTVIERNCIDKIYLRENKIE